MTVISSVRSARCAWQLLRDAGAVTFAGVREAVETLPQEIRHPVGVHFGWWDEAGDPATGNSGKAVRPALALLACEAVGGEQAAGAPAAVAVELVHNASLLHDDIIDGDRMRRGRPAVWAALGVPAGILAGDALFFLACQVLLAAPAPLGTQGVSQLTAAVQALIGGEYVDTLFEKRSVVSVKECAVMTAGKTGALMAAACGLGALAGGAAEARVEHLRAFGAHLGAAFQLVDDLLGIWGDPRHTGKPVGSDLVFRKKSLPVAYACAADNAAGRELVRLYGRHDRLTAEESERAAHLVEKAGGRAWATSEARRHVRTAVERLSAAHPVPVVAAELTALAQLITERQC
ncbi:polyprenyl synthetase family protein [Streptomyces sp. ISL-36]|uniref:polyprenyl synthetase family protein n=1 Tax=Streptomyces sp. ISL-36 TaxID=2819182 RepID=UPI001BE76D0E|nr:polyprenyl synthetase family protein [Streptomyces sp. ISL-36]MBT2442717.1 polyprenyl synthetase family protein [Streptomyces sp. ISL-36]